MKKILSLIFLCVFCLNAINADVTWELSEDGTLTISGYGYMNSIPWSSQRENIKKVTINNGVTGIISSAFLNCPNLKTITIPNSVTSIGGSAFSGCTSLHYINIPNNVISIGEKGFYGCIGLTSINIPNSVTTIGVKAFEGCYILKDNFVNDSKCDNGSVTLIDIEQEDGLLIKNSKVIKCRNWSTSVTIPNIVTTIDMYAFRDYTGLKSVNISNSVTSIGVSAFYGCTGLRSINIPNH